jgi:TPP-dependent pyruvate/acetoin dehydrogenase alpha subunit
MGNPDLLHLYGLIYRSRMFEELVVQLWNEGHITGEMHTSIGEEAIYAGVIDHLETGDALALDHRTTSPSLIRGLDPSALLLEFLGHEKGVCSGMGGHMHLFSESHLLVSSGIVGASGPAACGFALAARQLRPGKIAVAFFGEGAANQGMMMESFNMASAMKLPVLFVCKDNGMAISTPSSGVTGGSLIARAEAFGLQVQELDGAKSELVWEASGNLISGLRSGSGPAFLLARCYRPQGHFLGDPLLRIRDSPMRELSQITGPLLKSVTRRKGASLGQRAGSLKKVGVLLGNTLKPGASKDRDPLALLKKKLSEDTSGTEKVEQAVKEEMEQVLASVLNHMKEGKES